MQIQEHNPSSEQRNSNWVVRWTALALPVVLVLGALAGVGFLGLRFLRERQLQDELAPVPPIEIAVIYPGASAEIVESTITDALEQQLAGTSGIRRIESHSMPGVSKIIVHLDPGVDRQFLMELVRNRAALAQPILPAGAGQPAFSSPALNREPAVWVFLSGGQPVERIAEAAEKEVKPRLAGLSSVSSVQFGRLPPGESLREPSLHLVIDREKCRTLEIPVTDVLELLNKALKNQKVTSAKDIGNPIISFHDGKPVRIKDVAEVKDTITVRCRTRIDGKPVIAIGLHAATDTKPADIVQAVKDAFPQIRPHLPEGIGFAVISGR